MTKLLMYFFIGVLMNSELTVFDFSSGETSGIWRTINDDVMGGISQSKFKLNSDGTATFSGNLSLENNGGFASVRASVMESEREGFDGAILRVKGDGKTYNLRFRTNQNYDGVSYQAKFNTEVEKWIEIKLPFDNFEPVFRGRKVPNQPLLESQNIGQTGILIADEQLGVFNLQISWLKFYRDE